VRLTRPAAALLAAALLLTGCGADEPTEPEGHNDVHVEHEEAPASPSWDAQAAADAEQVAFNAMTAYVSPPEEWWNEVQPYLTPDSQARYSNVDPTRIEPSRLLASSPGDLQAAEDPRGPYFALVEVPTNTGVFTVKLFREGAGQPWLVQEFEVPAGE
jgi:hypothetical protein